MVLLPLVIRQFLLLELFLGANTGGENPMEQLWLVAVRTRLKCFGYEVKAEDEWGISFVADKVEQHIKNVCNITTIPKEVQQVAVDMVCGEFLFLLKQSGKLDQLFHLETPVESIQTGDTNITFDTSQSPEQRCNALISYLVSKGEGAFLCYRKVKW